MSWTLCTSGAAVVKAGAGANSSIIVSGSALSGWSDEVEGRIVTNTRRNWVTEYGSIGNTGVKNLLSEVSSDLIAMKIIAYDMKGFTSRFEAQLMLDQLRDNALGILKWLTDFKADEIRSIS